MHPPIAITMGDPAGIGPEIIVKAFRDAPELVKGCFVVGDVASLRRAAGFVMSEGQVPLPIFHMAELNQAAEAPSRCVPVLQIPAQTTLVPVGQISGEAGKMAGSCVLWAARAALGGTVAAMVTAPLHKEALSAAGHPYAQYPGHTEMLQAQAAAWLGRPVTEVPVRMMLANDELRTVLVSIHLSLRDAIEAVTSANVLQTIQITDAALRASLGRAPLIGVAGLNPHAGEGGLFGNEERLHIQPAIASARALGIDVRGPFAPDTVFMRARRQANAAVGEFDVVIAMYHDQGLIPVKYLGVEQGVNVTLGLPMVRTSPDHGTAFDIAGQGLADASSLLAAIRMARQLVAHRAASR